MLPCCCVKRHFDLRQLVATVFAVRLGRRSTAPREVPTDTRRRREASKERHPDDVRQHQRHDRPDAGVLVVLLGKPDDQREVGVQRRDRIDRRIADPVGRQHGFGIDANCTNSGTKIGAKMAHLAIAPVMSRSRIATTTMKPSSSHSGADVRALEHVGHRHGHERRHVGVVEVGDELADDQEQEDGAAQAGDRLCHCVDDVRDVLHRLGADAVGGPGHQEQDHDDGDQAVHERRVADQGAGVRIAQRRTRRECQQTEEDQHRQQPEGRVPQPARFVGGKLRALFGGASPPICPPDTCPGEAR